MGVADKQQDVLQLMSHCVAAAALFILQHAQLEKIKCFINQVDNCTHVNNCGFVSVFYDVTVCRQAFCERMLRICVVAQVRWTSALG